MFGSDIDDDSDVEKPADSTGAAAATQVFYLVLSSDVTPGLSYLSVLLSVFETNLGKFRF